MFSGRSCFLTEIKPSELEFASHDSNGEENLKQLIQEFAPKTVQTEFAVRHGFERKTIC